ncbi:MAG: guanylate kinase [Planctomycetota bacterium]|nr:MAG: guanylate kinase [Planctomycetota bacterium]RKY12238.1 MAG: guanylate kinase [Planctomycetota bacterium]
MTESEKQKKLIIISGPSGVGKSTICKQVVEKLGAFLSVSSTTRSQSESEEQGREYNFLSRQEFEENIQNNAFLEYAEVFCNYYGTPTGPVDEALAAGRIVILEIDIQGALRVKKVRPWVQTIFILPPRTKDLRQRIDGRGRGEDEETKKRRLETASREIAAAWQHYDHMVINDDLGQAVQEVVDIIDEKLKETI